MPGFCFTEVNYSVINIDKYLVIYNINIKNEQPVILPGTIPHFFHEVQEINAILEVNISIEISWNKQHRLGHHDEPLNIRH